MDINKGDLTLQTDQGILNIRVLLLIENSHGYIFEQHEDGYFFAIGGRVKFNETSQKAAIRELKEEINRNDIKLEFYGIIENYFKLKDISNHEINFIYHGKIKDNFDLTGLHSDHIGFKFISSFNINDLDIKPLILKKIITNKEKFFHFVN